MLGLPAGLKKSAKHSHNVEYYTVKICLLLQQRLQKLMITCEFRITIQSTVKACERVKCVACYFPTSHKNINVIR
jgi:hypothetical protein